MDRDVAQGEGGGDRGNSRGGIRLLVAGSVLLIAVVGAAVIGRPSDPPVGEARVPPPPSASAPTSASPSVTAAPTSAAARTHTSDIFGITYELPLGWVNSREGAFWFLISTPAGQESLEGMSVFRDGVVADQDAACAQTPKPGLGYGVHDFVTYLTNHPGLVTSEPAPVAIGGMTGVSLDLSVAPTWTQQCSFNGLPTVMFLTGAGGSHYLWGADRFEYQRVAFLDDGAGGAVVIVLNSRSESGLAALVQTATPTLDSLVIEARLPPTHLPSDRVTPTP